jgi:hypothetical protein
MKLNWICRAVVGMDSEIGVDNCTEDLTLVGRRSESGSKEEGAHVVVNLSWYCTFFSQSLTTSTMIHSFPNLCNSRYKLKLS